MEVIRNDELPPSQPTDQRPQASSSDDHELYETFALLLSDQLNVPDVNTVLDTQRQM